jgi:hypothetical protein
MIAEAGYPLADTLPLQGGKLIDNDRAAINCEGKTE